MQLQQLLHKDVKICASVIGNFLFHHALMIEIVMVYGFAQIMIHQIAWVFRLQPLATYGKLFPLPLVPPNTMILKKTAVSQQ